MLMGSEFEVYGTIFHSTAKKISRDSNNSVHFSYKLSVQQWPILILLLIYSANVLILKYEIHQIYTNLIKH